LTRSGVVVVLGSALLLAGAGGAGSQARPAWTIDWIAWAPGSSILFHGNGTHSIRADGSGSRRLLPRGYGASWAPDRRSLAVQFGEGGIAVAELRRSGLRRLTRGGFNPIWSPTGDRIAYQDSLFDDVRVVRADGSGDRIAIPLRFGQNFTRENDWSPDGRKLVFSACLRPVPEGQACPDAVYVADLARPANRRRISPNRGTCPDWSATGAIAFLDGGGVAVVRSLGSRPQRVLRSAASCPAWSPDGSRLAVEGPRSLLVARADGRSRYRLTTLPPLPCCTSYPNAPAPAWSPDGRRIAVARVLGHPQRVDLLQYRIYVVDVRTRKKRIVVQTRWH
jgi:hypothetical protein